MGGRIQKVEKESVTGEKWLVHSNNNTKNRAGERNKVKESEQPS